MVVEVGTHEDARPADVEGGMPSAFRRVRLRTPRLEHPEAALASLLTPARLPELHPLITRIDEEPVREEGTRRIADFLVHEGVPMLGGLVRWPNRSRGRVVLDTARPGEARLSAWSWPGVRIELRYQLIDGSLEERSWVHAPWWVEPFVFRTFVDSHRRTLEAVSRSRPR